MFTKCKCYQTKMQKTSASQFEMMVDYMERNGDLSKPTTEGPSGRLTNLRRWEELANILNADATGDTKKTDKWRKVWTDLKNNTKRKKARILQSASGTGGGPASKLQLTDLEDRVLNVIGPQAASGIPEVPEIGINQEIILAGTSQFLPLSPPPAQETSEALYEDLHQSVISSLHEPASSLHEPAGSLHEPAGILHEPAGSLHEPAGCSHEPAASPQTPTSRRRITPRVRLTPRRLLSPRRRRLDQNATSPVQRRKARLQTQSERARQEFLESDREWRAFFMNREQEGDRIREIEVAQQARWQELFEKLLVTCNAAIDILKNKNI